MSDLHPAMNRKQQVLLRPLAGHRHVRLPRQTPRHGQEHGRPLGRSCFQAKGALRQGDASDSSVDREKQPFRRRRIRWRCTTLSRQLLTSQAAIASFASHARRRLRPGCTPCRRTVPGSPLPCLRGAGTHREDARIDRVLPEGGMNKEPSNGLKPFRRGSFAQAAKFSTPIWGCTVQLCDRLAARRHRGRLPVLVALCLQQAVGPRARQRRTSPRRRKRRCSSRSAGVCVSRQSLRRAGGADDDTSARRWGGA